MSSCVIEPVDRGSVERLDKIGRRTFIATFARDNNPDDFTAYLDEAFDIQKLSKELEAEGSSFFFALVNGQIAGYLKLNTGNAQTESIDGDTLEIERIYVDPDFQGSGVGKALLMRSIDEATRQRFEAVWLGVWENNPDAIDFYEKLGFRSFGKHDFVIGGDVQTDILMRRDL